MSIALSEIENLRALFHSPEPANHLLGFQALVAYAELPLAMSYSNHYFRVKNGQHSRDWTLIEWIRVFRGRGTYRGLSGDFFRRLRRAKNLATSTIRDMGYGALQDLLADGRVFPIARYQPDPKSRRGKGWAQVSARWAKTGFVPLCAWEFDFSGQGEGFQLVSLAIRCPK